MLSPEVANHHRHFAPALETAARVGKTHRVGPAGFELLRVLRDGSCPGRVGQADGSAGRLVDEIHAAWFIRQQRCPGCIHNPVAQIEHPSANSRVEPDHLDPPIGGRLPACRRIDDRNDGLLLGGRASRYGSLGLHSRTGRPALGHQPEGGEGAQEKQPTEEQHCGSDSLIVSLHSLLGS